MASSDWQTLVDDLEAESRVVQSAIDGADDEAWDRPSPAEGWTLRDCVVHLAETDDSATAGVTGETLSRDGRREGVLTAGMLRGRTLTPAEIREWYRSSNARLVAALRALNGDERLTWVGRPMSARSYTTARLMEHWAHGLDILEAAGVAAVDTDRLRHIALLGHLTRDFAYRTHGLEPPSTPLYVELTAPSGATWRFGPEDAPGPHLRQRRRLLPRRHPAYSPRRHVPALRRPARARVSLGGPSLRGSARLRPAASLRVEGVE